MLAGDIDAEVQRATLSLAIFGERCLFSHPIHQGVGGQEAQLRLGAARQQLIGDEGGGVVGGNAAIFLEPLFLVEAFGADALEEGIGRFGAAGFPVDAFDDAFGDGFMDGVGVEMPAHGIALFADVADELVEERIAAAVSGDDGERAAPLGDGFGDEEKLALVGVEGELVDFDMAAFAGEGVGVGGEAMDAAAVGELKDMGGEALNSVEDDEAEVGGGAVEDFGPSEAVFEVEAGLEFVAGGEPDIEAGAGEGGFHDGVEGVGFGGADLARFFPDFERGRVAEPGGLGREEPGLSGEIKICAISLE